MKNIKLNENIALINFNVEGQRKSNIKELKDMNKHCYFCNFIDVMHRHHIIRKSDGGSNKEINIIGLCPNHHSILHKEGVLTYKNGYYYMRKTYNDRKKIGEIIAYPTLFQSIFKRVSPYDDIKRAIKKGKLYID